MSPITVSRSQSQVLYRVSYCSLSALLLLCLFQTCDSVDTISANQTISDGETIVSAGERFEMGFFSRGNSRNRYVGIWYKDISIQTVVWVANREIPVTNTSGGGGVLRLNPGGVLEILNATNSIVWSSNSSGFVSNPVAQLLDNGNFVIRPAESDSNPDNFIWQSFDFPGNTLIPGMILGTDFVTGKVWSYSSWKSDDDPSPGNFTTFVDATGYPQNIEMEGTKILTRGGPWNGRRFSGEPNMESPFITYTVTFDQKGIFYRDEATNSSVLTMVVLSPSGGISRSLWIDSKQAWKTYGTRVTDDCDSYGLCGVNGNCNINNHPYCGCLEGFEPRFPDQWIVADWSGGCQRTMPLDCGAKEGFKRYSDKKLPDTRHSWYNLSMNLEECKQLCKSNCSCTAYANADVRDRGSGCILWFGDLLDVRDFPNRGQDVYIRLAASELMLLNSKGKAKVLKLVKIIMPIVSALFILLGFFLFYTFKRRKLKREGEIKKCLNGESQSEDLELPVFAFSTLLKATNNFSTEQKLGEGAFGQVYKGTLCTGQEIAVKRLSKNSRQGLKEFKNEILLISKLQHRNLVKILGCCFEGEERMIAYEYMPNKSLDCFIFGKEKRKLLTIEHCMDIGVGIAKGLLYLHDDSRLRIIHRDLKATNVLLDKDMIPKISDFGIARIFGGDQGEEKTKHVIGTYGYMSPEYSIHGKFSVKSDAFSFGVLLIEIMSGKRNTKYQHPDHHHSLLGHAWLLWKEGKALELVDANLEDPCLKSQVLRFIQVGLLCIQKFPIDRPTMSSVVFMLSNEGVTLPEPKEPGFFIESNFTDAYGSLCEGGTSSKCALTITAIGGSQSTSFPEPTNNQRLPPPPMNLVEL